MVLGESGAGGQSAGSGSAGAGNSGVDTSQNAGAGAAGNSQAGSGASGGSASWRDSLPADLKDNPALASYSDVASLAKSYVHAQGLIGKKGVFVPTDKSSEDDWKKFYSDLGQPTLDKFEVKLPDGFEANQNFVAQFKENAYKAGLLPKQAQGLMDWYIGNEKKMVAEQTQATQNKQNAELAELKKEWGEAYQSKLGQAEGALDLAEKAPGLEKIKGYLTETGYGKDPMVIKLVSWAASLLGEGKLVGDGSGKFGQTPSEIQGELDSIRNDLQSPYYDNRHADHARINDRVAQLYQKLADSQKAG